MIFYFSGTGNSYSAAKNIANKQNDRLLSIAQENEKQDAEYSFAENELLGFVYPVYAWGPPKIVLDFIAKMKVSGGKPYVFSLSTCGGQEGNTTRMMQKALHRKGLELDSAFTLKMPSNYIIGFDVDPEEMVQSKLYNAEEKLKEINTVIGQRQKGIYDIIPGKSPALKTYLANPRFNRFARSTKKFYATDECTGCKKCERICPLHTISVADKPVWGKSCTQCLACINNCPAQAIQYGNTTISRGRYVHPKIDEK